MLLCKNMRDSRGFCSCHVVCSRNRMWQMSVRREIQPQMDSVGTNVIIRRLLCTRTKLMMTSGCTGVNPNTPASCHSRPLTKRPGGRIRAGLSSKSSRTALWRSGSITWKTSKGSWLGCRDCRMHWAGTLGNFWFDVWMTLGSGNYFQSLSASIEAHMGWTTGYSDFLICPMSWEVWSHLVCRGVEIHVLGTRFQLFPCRLNRDRWCRVSVARSSSSYSWEEGTCCLLAPSVKNWCSAR